MGTKMTMPDTPAVEDPVSPESRPKIVVSESGRLLVAIADRLMAAGMNVVEPETLVIKRYDDAPGYPGWMREPPQGMNSHGPQRKGRGGKLKRW